MRRHWMGKRKICFLFSYCPQNGPFILKWPWFSSGALSLISPHLVLVSPLQYLHFAPSAERMIHCPTVCLFEGGSMKAKFETESSPRGNLRDPPGEVSLASQFPLLPPPLLPSCFPPAPQLVSGSPQSPQPQSAVPPHLLLLLLLPHHTPLLLRFHCLTQLLPKTSDRDNHVIAICKE